MATGIDVNRWVKHPFWMVALFSLAFFGVNVLVNVTLFQKRLNILQQSIMSLTAGVVFTLMILLSANQNQK